jgi:hypothetical protein
MARTKERAVPVRLAADRTLYYVLQIPSGSENLVDQCCQVLNAVDAKALKDYATRVLSRLVDNDRDESDDEAEEEQQSPSSSSSATTKSE